MYTHQIIENTKHFKLEYKKGENWVTITDGKKIGEVFQTSFKRIRYNLKGHPLFLPQNVSI